MRRGQVNGLFPARLLTLALTLFAALAAGSALESRPATAQPALDAQAVTLAKQVRAGGPNAQPALRSALALAGFGVRDADGTLAVEPAQQSQGLLFESWEVEAMTALIEQGFRAPLVETGAAIAASLPELNDAPVDRLLLDGVRTNARGDRPALRFWAQFIAALGREGSQPVDLLGAVEPADVQLDAVQFGLLLRRLSGDLYALGLASPEPGTSAGASVSGLAGAAGSAFHYRTEAQTTGRPLPCSLGSTEGLIMDGAALVTGLGYGALLDYLKEHGIPAAERFAKVTGAANAVLAYVKLAWTLGAFTMDMGMAGDGPLVRTKLRHPRVGERRELWARVFMDIGRPQLVNCFRPMLNAAGLDFSLPTDGAVAGADIEWVLVDNGGGNEPLAGIVQFAGSDQRHRTTDSQGVSRVDIEGTGQRRDLSANAVPVRKSARVRANTALKPANIVQDLIDASGAGLGGPLALATMPAEMLYRGKWALSYDYTVPVTDWEEGRWLLEGTVTDDRQGSTAEGHDPSSHRTVRIAFKAELSVIERPENEAAWAALEPEVREYSRQLLRQGWHLRGDGTGTLSISSYDSHPGTTYNCRASDSGPAKVVVLGKLHEGRARLMILAVSDRELSFCLAHGTMPVRGGVVATTPYQTDPAGGFITKDTEMLEIELVDGASGRLTLPGRETSSTARHTITWEGKVTAIPTP